MKRIIKKIMAWAVFFAGLIPAILVGLAVAAFAFFLDGHGPLESIVLGIVAGIFVVVFFSTLNID